MFCCTQKRTTTKKKYMMDMSFREQTKTIEGEKEQNFVRNSKKEKEHKIFPLSVKCECVRAWVIKYPSAAFRRRKTNKKKAVSDSVNPPHMSASSSELSPQSSLPSQTHVCSLHSVLLQMNSSARQKKAPER